MRYNSSMAQYLRYRFPGSETIQTNYSQAGQDLFVLSMLNGRRNGTYLEIGSSIAEQLNNTCLLEREFDWTGVGVEIVPDYVAEYNSKRKNQSVVADATTVDVAQVLNDAGITDTDIDYLSCDCEPPSVTLAALKNIPHDIYRFAVITFEHDAYVHGNDIKLESREFLSSLGYVLVASNISENGIHVDFEDWWVHPELVDPVAIEAFMAAGDDVKPWMNYIYPNAAV